MRQRGRQARDAAGNRRESTPGDQKSVAACGGNGLRRFETEGACHMSKSTVLELLEQIAETVVFIDQDTPAGFATVENDLTTLSGRLADDGRLQESAICANAAHLAGGLAKGFGNPAQALKVLTAGLDALRASLGQECHPEDAGFPAELATAEATAVVSESLAEPAPGNEPAVACEVEVAAEVAVEVDVAAACEEAPVEAAPIAVAAPVVRVPVTPSASDVLSMVDESIMSEFLARQADVLDEIEKELLNVEDGTSEGDLTGLLRFFHTLKGESALLGMPHVAELCHATEDMMQSEPLAACVERLLDVKDWLGSVMRQYSGGNVEPAPVMEIMARLKEIPAAPAPAVAPTVATPVAPVPVAAEEAEVATYEVVAYIGHNVLDSDTDLIHDFVAEAVEHLDASEGHLLAIEKDPHQSEALNAVFRAFHTIKGLAGFIELEHIKDLAHKAENLLDMARRSELELVGNNMDLVFESVDMMKRLVEGVTAALGGDGRLTGESRLASLMTRLVAATDTKRAAPAPVVAATPAPGPVSAPAAAPKKPGTGFIPLGNMKKTASAPAAQAAAPAPVAAAPVTPVATAEADGEQRGGKAPSKVREAMRVDAERLDHLIETIGELVIAESMVSQSPEIKRTGMSVKLAKDIDHLDKICRELQEIGMSLRMVPVRPVFQKMARLVRDLSKKQDREVEFVVSGEDTELDKNVVDKIGDPLVHMVRNAVDHGIEADTADRLKLGKPAQGRIELRAFHKGGNICIEIEDDGKGLDREAILAKAISRGMLREGENPSDRDLFALIFEPGFSTAKQVTDISGRGVGMDVVRRNIEELRGTVDISSSPGKGSTFSIKLPLTLAIIEGMVIRVGQEHYIIPTLSVVRLIRPQARDVTHVFDRGEMLAFEGNHLPLFRLAGLFDVNEAKVRPEEAMVVVVEDEGRKVGLMADELLGQQSIVIKSLGETMQGTDGVAGGAIMSNGNVALILDIAGIVRVAHQVDTTAHSRVCRGTATATLDQAVTAGGALPAMEYVDGDLEAVEGREPATQTV
jgi:two-component system chemotaxis sensor kinase CheA